MRVVKRGLVKEATDVSMINTPTGKLGKDSRDKKKKRRKVLTCYGKVIENMDPVWRTKLKSVYGTKVGCFCGAIIIRDYSGPPWVCFSCGDTYNIR